MLYIVLNSQRWRQVEGYQGELAHNNETGEHKYDKQEDNKEHEDVVDKEYLRTQCH